MDIFFTNHLTDKQLSEVRKLLLICKNEEQLDGICLLNADENALTEFPCFYLLYDDNLLTCFISVFTPSFDHGEVYAYTHPIKRNTGCFKLLLDSVIDQFEKHHIEDLYFCIESNSISGTITAKHMDAEYVFSECIMKYYGQTPLQYPKGILDYTAVTDENTIILTFFKISRPENRVNYKQVIGICKIDTAFHCATIYDLEIIKLYRGKGFGKELLLQILQYLQEQNYKNIMLQVTSTNEPAYSLYLNNNFKIVSQIDYYIY